MPTASGTEMSRRASLMNFKLFGQCAFPSASASIDLLLLVCPGFRFSILICTYDCFRYKMKRAHPRPRPFEQQLSWLMVLQLTQQRGPDCRQARAAAAGGLSLAADRCPVSAAAAVDSSFHLQEVQHEGRSNYVYTSHITYQMIFPFPHFIRD